MGTNTLEKFLPQLSKKCELSQTYTNLSLRATAATVQLLHEEKYAPAAVQSVYRPQILVIAGDVSANFV